MIEGDGVRGDTNDCGFCECHQDRKTQKDLSQGHKEAQLVPGCLWVEGHYPNMGSFVVSLNMFPNFMA